MPYAEPHMATARVKCGLMDAALFDYCLPQTQYGVNTRRPTYKKPSQVGASLIFSLLSFQTFLFVSRARSCHSGDPSPFSVRHLPYGLCCVLVWFVPAFVDYKNNNERNNNNPNSTCHNSFRLRFSAVYGGVLASCSWPTNLVSQTRFNERNTRKAKYSQGDNPCLFSIVSSAPLLMRYSPIFPLVSYDMAKCSAVFPVALQWFTLAPRCTKNSTTGICEVFAYRGIV